MSFIIKLIIFRNLQVLSNFRNTKFNPDSTLFYLLVFLFSQVTVKWLFKDNNSISRSSKQNQFKKLKVKFDDIWIFIYEGYPIKLSCLLIHSDAC